MISRRDSIGCPNGYPDRAKTGRGRGIIRYRNDGRLPRGGRVIRVERKIATRAAAALMAALMALLLAALLAGCGDVTGAAEPAAEEPASVTVEEPAAISIDLGDIPAGGVDEYPTTAEECICGDEALELLEKLNEERAAKAAVED